MILVVVLHFQESTSCIPALLPTQSIKEPTSFQNLSIETHIIKKKKFGKTVCDFSVAKELLIWQVDLPIGKPFSLAPGDIFGYGAAFFLRIGCQNGQH